MKFGKLKEQAFVSLIIIFMFFGYTDDTLGSIIIDNFTIDPITGGFGSETVDGGGFCCPSEFRPNFVEEHAVAFTVDRLYRLDAFEFLLDDDGAKDLLRIDLSIGSSTNPGGSESALNFLAPDGDNSIETWVLTDAVPNIIDTFHVDSIINPVLRPGELYWIALSPGELAPFESLIRIEWVFAEEEDPLVQAFGRRNNVNGGNIEDILWVTGVSNMSRTLRVFATPVPEPTTLALFATGLAGLGFMMRRRRRST